MIQSIFFKGAEPVHPFAVVSDGLAQLHANSIKIHNLTGILTGAI